MAKTINGKQIPEKYQLLVNFLLVNIITKTSLKRNLKALKLQSFLSE